MKEALRKCITEHIKITPEVWGEIGKQFEYAELQKGKHIVHSGETCRKLAFINEGILRIYNVNDGREITLWIAAEHEFMTALTSFVFGKPSYWNIDAVTDCKLLIIGRDKHFELLNHYPEWLEFDNRILAGAFSTLEERMYSHICLKARDRYKKLMNENPELFNRVPLQHIASMLGMTPETLSRIRSNSIS